jgi:hypothetical protein
MAEARASYPRFKRAGGERPIELTDDDLAILQHVHRHRFIRASDLQRLLDHRSQDKLSRRLTWLFRAGYLDRPPAQIDRFGEGGSRSLVYGLGSAGGRVLKERLGARVGPTDWRSRNRSYTRENLDHTLAVTDYMVSLELACRARPDVQLIRFEDMLKDAPETTRRSAYPGRWAVPVQWSLAKAEVLLIPDAIFGLRVEQDGEPARRSYVFLEVDRGTMTIAPARRVQESDAFLYRATILRKLLAYAESYRLALHKEYLEIPTARVLFLTTSEVRAEGMRRVAHDLVVGPLGLPEGLFLFGVQSGDDPFRSEFQNSIGAEIGLVG